MALEDRAQPFRGGGPGPGRGGRRRPPPRLVEVVNVSQLTPRMVAVRVTGENLSAFAEMAPTSHVKVFLPPADGSEFALPEAGPEGLQWPEGARPTVRTYTPRRYDAAASTLEIQFVLHGDGPAAAWAASAAVGDRLGVAGPGGRFSLNRDVRHWWIAADESALPAVGTLLEALPDGASAEVHLEVDGPADELELPSSAAVERHWHHRRAAEAPGERLYQAVRASTILSGSSAAGVGVWAACEAAGVRRIRKVLLEERGLSSDSVTTRGYWRAGEANHPDHDYGE